MSFCPGASLVRHSFALVAESLQRSRDVFEIDRWPPLAEHVNLDRLHAQLQGRLAAYVWPLSEGWDADDCWLVVHVHDVAGRFGESCGVNDRN